jgi:hypothetical protein
MCVYVCVNVSFTQIVSVDLAFVLQVRRSESVVVFLLMGMDTYIYMCVCVIFSLIKHWREHAEANMTYLSVYSYTHSHTHTHTVTQTTHTTSLSQTHNTHKPPRNKTKQQQNNRVKTRRSSRSACSSQCASTTSTSPR